MTSEKEFENILPEVKWINDEELKKKVIEVWLEAISRGGWRGATEIPFTLSFKNSGTLVEHTRRVTKLVKSVASSREENINMDYLIAGALLHDIGKALEYEKVGNEIRVSEYGKKVRHPISGAQLARELGVPEEVAHIIESHSHEGDKMKRSKESIIVHHCDFIDFELRRREVEGD